MQKFQKAIEELIKIIRELISLENIKLRAAADKRASGVEECITKEQALILRLKGADKEREREQEALGCQGLTFREILEKVSEEERELLLPLFDQLSREIQMFQEVSEDTHRILEVNIRHIQNTIDAAKGTSAGVYTGNGSEKLPERHMTNRKA